MRLSMGNERTVLISRKFDVESGSAEWMLAENIYNFVVNEGRDVKKIQQNFGPKLWHDWITIPVKCLWYRLRGYSHFFFISENQATPVILLNLTGATTQVYFHDLMRVQNEKKGVDHHYFVLIYWLASKAKQICANSIKTGNELVNYFGEHISKKISVIPPYVDEFKMDKTNRRYNIIGYLGALSARKRPLKLIELAKYLKDNGLDYKVEVWGSGELKSKMQTMIEQFQLENYIELMGHAPEAEKEKIYNSFGYFFFPTEKEGYGLPAHESVSCGVPCFILPDAEMAMEVKQNCIVVKDPEEIIKAIKIINEEMDYIK